MKPLTLRESEAMRLICLGHSNKECAEIMDCNIKTIEKHRQSVYYKWGVDSITPMIRVALRHGHLPVEKFLAATAGENKHHERPQNLERINAPA